MHRRRWRAPSVAAVLGVLMAASTGYAQQVPFDRLPLDRLEVTPPSARVRGTQGSMRVESHPCRTLPEQDLRRRLVDVAVQEWAFFGFSLVDETNPASWVRPRRPPGSAPGGAPGSGPVVVSQARLDEAARVASSIAGYWAVTPEGAWVVDRQNRAWTESAASATRWVEPWSAAFISWVMCEAGLGSPDRFRRAVAHHVYIDQAIRARDERSPGAAFVAYDVGETAIAPGDLLCFAQRPSYRTIADRRRQIGVGARTHCDVVVQVDEARTRLLAIGGNVRGTVGLKLIPAQRDPGRPLRPLDRSTVDGARAIFAHLKLRTDPIDVTAFDSSPTVTALVCTRGFQALARLAAASLFARPAVAERC